MSNKLELHCSHVLHCLVDWLVEMDGWFGTGGLFDMEIVSGLFRMDG